MSFRPRTIPIRTTGSNSFSNEGFQLPDEVEARIEQLIVSDEIKHLVADGGCD